MNELVNINFDNMSQDELMIYSEQINAIQNNLINKMLNGMTKRIKELEDWKEKTNSCIKIANNKIEIHNDKIKMIEDATRSQYIDRVQREKIITAKKKRVMKIVGGKKSLEYILFYGGKNYGYMAKLGSMLNKTFDLSSYSDLYQSDYQDAIKFIKNWFPTKKLTNEIIVNLLQKQEKGDLNGLQSQALDKYLEKESGGRS
jgi:hypothetical protein